MKLFDRFFSNSKLNKLESESYDSEGSTESDLNWERKEKIRKRKPTGKKKRKSSAELEKINKNYERNQSLRGSWQFQKDEGSFGAREGLDMQEKTTKVRFNSHSQINTQITWELSNSKTENDFIEKIIPDKKLEASQAIDCENKEKTGDVTSEPNKKDNNVDTDQHEKYDDVKSERLEVACTDHASSKIPQYAKKKKSNDISLNKKKPSSFIPKPISPIKL